MYALGWGWSGAISSLVVWVPAFPLESSLFKVGVDHHVSVFCFMWYINNAQLVVFSCFRELDGIAQYIWRFVEDKQIDSHLISFSLPSTHSLISLSVPLLFSIGRLRGSSYLLLVFVLPNLVLLAYDGREFILCFNIISTGVKNVLANFRSELKNSCEQLRFFLKSLRREKEVWWWKSGEERSCGALFFSTKVF